MKQFVLVPHDIIKSGQFEYDFNEKHGIITYRLLAKVRYGFIPYTIKEEGKQAIPPEELKSSAYSVVGKEISFANLKGKITKISGKHATAAISLSESTFSAAGIAIFDLSNTYVDLIHLDASGAAAVPVIGSVKFHLEAQRAYGLQPLAKRNTVWPIDDNSQKDGANEKPKA